MPSFLLCSDVLRYLAGPRNRPAKGTARPILFFSLSGVIRSRQRESRSRGSIGGPAQRSIREGRGDSCRTEALGSEGGHRQRSDRGRFLAHRPDHFRPARARHYISIDSHPPFAPICLLPPQSSSPFELPER